MTIHYTMTGAGDTLMVYASGFDESLAEVQEYGLAIISACVEGGFARVLCNESDLEYRLGTFDTYKAAAFISEQAPGVARIAIICNAKFINDAHFWETVAVNRGLTVRVFQEIGVASHWLSNPARQSDSEA